MGITHRVKLLSTHTITFYRYTPPQLTWGGVYEGGSTDPLPDIKGSLQPLSGGYRVNIIPDGYDTDSGYFWYTTYDHYVYKEGSQQLPDYCVINGRQYEVHNFEDWSSFGLKTDHNKYILIARTQSQ